MVKETSGLLEPNEEVGEERDQRGGYRGYRGDHARANHVIDEEKEHRYKDPAKEDNRMQLLQAVTDSD